MTSAKDIKKLTKNATIDTNEEVDESVLNGLLEQFDEAEEQYSAASQPSIWRTVIKSKIAKFAAAAMIVLAVGLFVARRMPDKQVEHRAKPEVAKSPAEMMTAMSLNIAYRKGGMEEVEKQCDKAFEMLGPRPGKISVQEILAELNGS